MDLLTERRLRYVLALRRIRETTFLRDSDKVRGADESPSSSDTPLGRPVCLRLADRMGAVLFTPHNGSRRYFRNDRVAHAPRVLRLAFSPNMLCRRPARIRCEDYGKIILKRIVHRFNYESLQTLADVGRAHSSNIIVMIGDDGLNCGNFLLGSHASTYGVRFCASNTKKILILKSYFLIFLRPRF